MRIVTFNVQHGRTPGGRVDSAGLARYCAGLGADVLALQEVDVRVARSRWADQAARVAQATGMVQAFGPAHRLGLVGRYGNALLCRGALADVQVLALPRLGRAEQRAALLATALFGGSRLSVATTHLSIHADEAPGQLEAVVAALVARPSPRLLLGDLNLRPGDVAPLVAAGGLALADPAHPTFPASAPRIRIDHVAVEGLAVRAVEVLPSAPVSDHRALAVDAVEASSPPRSPR
ncbi:MAG: endonuclease/exonuclease/phosphatase family protein [Actinomycetota bacterium]|nr:endonuclease/exonuclease/phosphatase family protein [Actinomycetota bacterium]